MTANVVRVRQNYWAILVAAVACFVFEAVWYSVFGKIWLSGIERTLDSLVQAGKAAGMNEWRPVGEFQSALAPSITPLCCRLAASLRLLLCCISMPYFGRPFP